MVESSTLTLFIIPVASGFLGAFLLWLIQQWYANRRERLKWVDSKIVKAMNSDRVITDSVFDDFGLGTSISHMKEVLGAPNKNRGVDYSVYLQPKDEVVTHSYLYIFGNAYMKVTSKDDQTIDTITIICLDKSISVSGVFMPADLESSVLGKAIITPQFVEGSRAEFIGTRFDSSFALQHFTGAPFYEHYTYFGWFDGDKAAWAETHNPQLFVGSVIDGVCISQTADDSYFIYENEIR